MPLRALLDQRVSGLCEDEVQSKVSFQWEALTAPFELQPGDETAGYSWWTMPPGVRSYNAEEYIGFDESATMVMSKLYPDDTACAFDIILGHSQGAILTAALLSIKPELQSTSNAPLGYILNGVAWPNPYQSNLTSLAQQKSDDSGKVPRLAFVMGKNDSINPIESAMQVHEAYGRAAFDVSIVHHEGGHSVPLGRDEDSVRALEELVDWIMEIARERAQILNSDS
ncbi:hypothetical protein ACHAXT_011720 [Thalassiosira profunda]